MELQSSRRIPATWLHVARLMDSAVLLRHRCQARVVRTDSHTSRHSSTRLRNGDSYSVGVKERFVAIYAGGQMNKETPGYVKSFIFC
jgi:hypothetical protein